MTTFVPLAADMDGTLSAIAIGDWLLQLIKVKKPDSTQQFYDELIGNFCLNADSKEQEIVDHVELFRLLLSQEGLVFECMQEASDNGDVAVIVTSPDGNADAPKEKEVRKTYAEIVREVDEMFSVLMSMLALRVPDDKIAGVAAGQLVDVLKKSITAMPEFRLKLLQALYNVFPPAFPYRFSIFLATLEYAAAADLFHLMVPYIQYIDEWMKDWNLNVAAQRNLFLLVANQLKKLNKHAEAYPFLRRHVEGFQGEDKTALSQEAIVTAASELAADSIRQPDVMYFDTILEMDAISLLRSTEHKSLVELLEIFLRGGPNEFLQFHGANTALFANHKLDKEECLNKIRLLALASRCVGCCELSLKELGETLGVTDTDAIEEIVVQAIGKGLVDAKLDQLVKSVQIKSAMHREFGKTQWEGLMTRLDIWGENVALLKKSVAEGKLQVSGERQTVF